MVTYPASGRRTTTNSLSSITASEVERMSIVSTQPTSPALPTKPHPEHIPRPPNKFMLYRSAMLKKLKQVENSEKHQALLSKEVAELWAAEPQEVKDMFGRLAEEEKRKHQLKYPGYVYQPGSRARAAGAAAKPAIRTATKPSSNRGRQGNVQPPKAQRAPTRSSAPSPSPNATRIKDEGDDSHFSSSNMLYINVSFCTVDEEDLNPPLVTQNLVMKKPDFAYNDNVDDALYPRDCAALRTLSDDPFMGASSLPSPYCSTSYDSCFASGFAPFRRASGLGMPPRNEFGEYDHDDSSVQIARDRYEQLHPMGGYRNKSSESPSPMSIYEHGTDERGEVDEDAIEEMLQFLTHDDY